MRPAAAALRKAAKDNGPTEFFNWISFNNSLTLARIFSLEGRTARGRTLNPNAMFSNTVMWRNKRIVLEHKPHAPIARGAVGSVFTVKKNVPESANSRPAIMRSSVVLPEPEGPSNATSSPDGISRFTLSSAVNWPNFLVIFCAVMLMRLLFLDSAVLIPAQLAPRSPLHDRLCHQGRQRQQGQQRCHGKCSRELVFVVQNFDVQRHGVGASANVARHHRNRTELPHGARIAKITP